MAFSLFSVAVARNAAEGASHSLALSDEYREASLDLYESETTIKSYQVQPAQRLRNELARAGQEILAAVRRGAELGDRDDRNLATKVQTEFTQYQAAVEKLFDSVDREKQPQEVAAFATQVNTSLSLIKGMVREADLREADSTRQALDRSRTLSTWALVGAVIADLMAFLLITFLGLQVVRHNRRVLDEAHRIEQLSRYDSLTGLPNRNTFTESLGSTLQSARGSTRALMVLLVDLDRFREINDVLGTAAGDEVLRQAASRLTNLVGGRREERDGQGRAMTARLGGNEFAVLLPVVRGPLSVIEAANRVTEELQRPYQLGEAAVSVWVSAGASVAIGGQHEVDDLLRQADMALDEAKTTKVGAVVFDPVRHVRGQSRLMLLTELRRAVDNGNEIVLYYQPKIDLLSGEIRGVEALARWHHPTRGLMPPSEFIPAAEGSGLILTLTTLLLDLALAQVRDWLDQGLHLPVAVNISTRSLADKKLPDRVTQSLLKYAVPAEMLRLEVTESTEILDSVRAMEILQRLREIGVRLAIDDFGTGYSSLSTLKTLTFDELKIDKSFVLGMGVEEGNSALVQASIDLGHTLGLTVVAEGVEASDHVWELRRMGCDMGQGYLFARPMPAADLQGWMFQNHMYSGTST
jgi:diguanylate cyclase